MDKFLVEMVKNQPDWFYTLSAIIFLLLLIFSAWWVGLGAKRFSDSMGRENKIQQLYEQLNEQKELSRVSQDTALQISTAIENVQYYISSLMRLKNDSEAFSTVESIVQAIAAEVKNRPGERHRVGLWAMVENNELSFIIGSSGFPEHYYDRKLDLDHSIAGKAFRKNQIIVRENVNQDEDWEPNPTSNSSYSSLICIPIWTTQGPWGVLTLDGLKPMTQEVLSIGKLYSKVIEVALDKHLYFIDNEDIEYSDEVASAREEF